MSLTMKTPRQQDVDTLLERLKEQLFVAVGGDLDGARVVTAAMVHDAFTQPLPDVQGHGADVTTPARVNVFGPCPDCHERAALSASLGIKSSTDPNGTTTLSLVAKSKPIHHTHGQQTLPEADQEPSFELEDIFGDEPRCTCAKGGADAERDERATTVADCPVHGEQDLDVEERGDVPDADEARIAEELLSDAVTDEAHEDDPDELLPEPPAS